MPPSPYAGAAVPGLDRAEFATATTVPALRIGKAHCHRLLSLLKGHVLDLPRVPVVARPPDDGDSRLLLLNKDAASVRAAAGPDAAAALDAAGAVDEEYVLERGYENLTADEVLKRILPPGVEPPSAFECVGHIAHLNLKEPHLPHGAVIGQVLLDKNPTIHTVVNKVGTINNEYRVFDMEVLAGSPNTVAEVSQYGLRFRLDFRQVYWNSRLEAEHARLVALFVPGDGVLDVMAGVGPFAVPAAKKGCTVWANDLNPASHAWLVENARLNKVGSSLAPFCADGRAFIRAAGGAATLPPSGPPTVSVPPAGAKGVPPPSPGVMPEEGVVFRHAIMNLPASAVDFLDAWRGALAGRAWNATRTGAAGAPPLPTVHVYTFARTGEGEDDVLARVRAALGLDQAGDKVAGDGEVMGGSEAAASGDSAPAALAPGTGPATPPTPPLSPALAATVAMVRDVAPNKRMLRVSFDLPPAVAFEGLEWGGGGGAGAAGGEQGDGREKRRRV